MIKRSEKRIGPEESDILRPCFRFDAVPIMPF